MAGGQKLRVSCGPVATFNPSKQEAKGGSDKAQDSIVLSMSNELIYLVPELHTHSCPVPGTDISRSLVAVGCEFQLPIDFSSGKAAALISAPGSVKSYSRLLAECLSACHEVALLLVREQRCWHRELVNSRR